MERWLKIQQLAEMEQETLVADCLLYAAAVTYFVAFPRPMYAHLLSKSRALCKANHLTCTDSDGFQLARALGLGGFRFLDPEVELLGTMGLPHTDPHTRCVCAHARSAASQCLFVMFIVCAHACVCARACTGVFLRVRLSTPTP